jgi:hypothetical protein
MSANAARIRRSEEREQHRIQWLERVQRELQRAEETETHRNPDPVVAHLDKMVEVSKKTLVLNPADKTDIIDRTRRTKLKIYTTFLDHLLSQCMEAARDRDRFPERDALLLRINDIFSKAVNLGAHDGLRTSVKEQLDIIRQTSPAGDSSTAKKDAERDAKRAQPAAHPRERRMFARWRDPALVVLIDGRPYKSVDWSLGGILIALEQAGPWTPGQCLDVKVGIEPTRLLDEKVEVLRADTSRMVVKSRRFASALMEIKRACDRDGNPPT